MEKKNEEEKRIVYFVWLLRLNVTLVLVIWRTKRALFMHHTRTSTHTPAKLIHIYANPHNSMRFDFCYFSVSVASCSCQGHLSHFSSSFSVSPAFVCLSHFASPFPLILFVLLLSGFVSCAFLIRPSWACYFASHVSPVSCDFGYQFKASNEF